MTTWDNVCRVCSSPAQYDVFSKIPNYLHASSNEWQNWQKPINNLLEETTGLKFDKDDGLPRSICAICISYLKHACQFRQQVIKNTLSLQVIKILRRDNANAQDKENLLITEQQLETCDQRKMEMANILQNDPQHEVCASKVSKELFQPDSAPSQEHLVQQFRYLNLLFDKDLNAGLSRTNGKRQTNEGSLGGVGRQQFTEDTEDYETETTSNDDENNETVALRKKQIFSYTEKNFEEDDIMDFDELRDAINITIPESCKERKCRACFRRFMFGESYKDHLDTCAEFRFLTFIEEINLLLDIRRKKAVSPHEFIRRMIFSLRKICEYLNTNCDENLMPSGSNGVGALDQADSKQQNNIKALNNAPFVDSVLSEKIAVGKTTLGHDEQEENFLRFPPESRRRNKLTEDLFTNSQAPPQTKGTITPISIHNNILYEIERAQNTPPPNARKTKTTNLELDNGRDCSNKTGNTTATTNTRLMRPKAVHAKAAQLQQSSSPIQTTQLQSSQTQHSDEERLTFLQKLERAAACQTPQQRPKQPNVTPSISVRKDLMPVAHVMPASPSIFSARCNPCNVAFDTISAFEIHNAMYHNEAAIDVVDNDAQPQQRRNSDEERQRIIAMFENEDDI